MEEQFVFKKIDSSKILQESYGLRYQVYCKECNFIRQEDYPEEIETDEFDRHSIHFGGFDMDERLIGAVRLITSSCDKFPIEEHCPQLDVDWNVVRRQECAEISRLTISKMHKRRAIGALDYECKTIGMTVEEKGQHLMRHVRPMAFGLYRAMYQECKRVGITEVFALMERSLWTLLKIHGFVFRQIGPEVDFYGKVTPYIASIPELGENIDKKFHLQNNNPFVAFRS